MARKLQQQFSCPVVIAIPDDERYAYTSENDLEKIAKNVKNTVKDLLAFGFEPARTFVYMTTDYIDQLYRNVCHVQKFTTEKVIKEAFEFTESDSVAMFALSAVRAAGLYASSFSKMLGSNKDMRALVLTAPDQVAFNQIALDCASFLE